MFLVDTNVFLEILLNQDKGEKCKRFLNTNINSIFISDFSLHSIGVILLRQKKTEIYRKFVADILSHVQLLSLPLSSYPKVVDIYDAHKLDFDDSYQFLIAKEFNLELVTMDNDFKKVRQIRVEFL
jgi:predicted nucleic acid-binding protein